MQCRPMVRLRGKSISKYPSATMRAMSGQWVYPMEVELCLAEHPSVRECAVLALELPDRRMTLKAFVVMNDRTYDTNATIRTLQDYVKQKLLPYKYPRIIKFMDALPKTGTGKIDRQALLRSTATNS